MLDCIVVGIPATLRKNARLRIGDSVAVERMRSKPMQAKSIQLSPSIPGSYAADDELAIYLKEYLGNLSCMTWYYHIHI